MLEVEAQDGVYGGGATEEDGFENYTADEREGEEGECINNNIKWMENCSINVNCKGKLFNTKYVLLKPISLWPLAGEEMWEFGGRRWPRFLMERL